MGVLPHICPHICVVIPTRGRPDGLRNALRSVASQEADGFTFSVVVSDNNPDSSARDAVEAFARTAPVSVTYVHAPEPGVSSARNAGLEAAPGEARYIAFLDDDQVAPPHWLARTFAASRAHGLVVVFCAVRARVGTGGAFLRSFFSRERPDFQTGPVGECFGTGGTLLDREAVPLPSPVFNPSMNGTGGEDDVLFAHIVAEGGVPGWAADTHVWEDIPADRARPAYVLLRSFAYGQGPTRAHADLGPFSPFGIANWMAVGAVQLAIHAPVGLGLLLLRRRDAALRHLSRASSGAGKVLWQKPFRPRLYG